MKRIAVALALILMAAVPGTAQTLDAVTAAEHALAEANDGTKLMAGVATLVSSRAGLYGAEQKRPSNHYKAGETILFYIEPVGLKHKPQGEMITCGLSMDLLVKRDGTIVFGKEGFLSADFPSRHPVQEIMLNGDLTIRAPTGPYELELVLHDHNSAEVGRATLPFVIDEAGAETAK